MQFLLIHFQANQEKTDRVFNQILDDLGNKSVDEWSEVTKEFVKGFPTLDPSNPNSAFTYRAMIEALKEYANNNDAVRIEGRTGTIATYYWC